jgi:hypothetical protein
MYIRTCATLGNTFVSVGRLGSISAPFGEPASRLLVQLNVRNMEEGKNNRRHSLVRLKEVHPCI